MWLAPFLGSNAAVTCARQHVDIAEWSLPHNHIGADRVYMHKSTCERLGQVLAPSKTQDTHKTQGQTHITTFHSSDSCHWAQLQFTRLLCHPSYYQLTVPWCYTSQSIQSLSIFPHCPFLVPHWSKYSARGYLLLSGSNACQE